VVGIAILVPVFAYRRAEEEAEEHQV
jgi:hypothetical protein